MTPRESEALQVLGLIYLECLERSWIYIFFYGASSLLEVRGSSICLTTGVFLALFSASVVIFVFVSYKCAYSLARPDASKSHRRRGFSKRATAVMFVTTVINLLLFSLSTGSQVAISIMVIRRSLNPDINLPLSEIALPRPGLVRSMSWSMILVAFWASYLPVSIKL